MAGRLPHAQPVAVSVDDIDELGVSRPEAVPAGATLEGGAGRVEAGNSAQRPLEVLSRKGDQVTAKRVSQKVKRANRGVGRLAQQLNLPTDHGAHQLGVGHRHRVEASIGVAPVDDDDVDV